MAHISDASNIYSRFFNLLSDQLKAMGYGDSLSSAITLLPPREAAHGDMATNAALVLAKQTGQKPHKLAGELAERLAQLETIAKAEVAGAGFVNLFLTNQCWQDEIATILRVRKKYGASQIGAGKRVSIEYVSANPTGPLHIGHARGAIFGDVLAALMEKIGYEITREYYVNDEGAQMDVLAQSLWRRVQGQAIEAGEGLYPGKYLIEAAQSLSEEYKQKLAAMGEGERQRSLRKKAAALMMALIKKELKEIDIKHKVFTYESALYREDRVAAAIAFLQDKNLIRQGVLAPPKGKQSDDWEAVEQTLFCATQFGDDSDRTVRTADGRWTYFAGDIAYHYDKCQRGFDRLINVFGSDHGGYVKRLQAATRALSDDKVQLDVCLMHLVRVVQNGKAKMMSKREGNFITLADLVEAIGAKALRFVMLTRKNSAPLDIDIDILKAQSNDNPVFYVQYAHARCCSVLRQAKEKKHQPDAASLTHLRDAAELNLIKILAHYPLTIEIAANNAAPHRLAFYLQELAAAFHALWNRGNEDARLKFIVADGSQGDTILKARLGLVCATQQVLANGLNLMGIKPAEKM